MMLGRLLAGVALVAAATGTASAQVVLDAKRAAAAFGARERVIDASLSPDGTRVAFVVPGPQQSAAVQVLDSATGSLKPATVADGRPFRLTGCGWASDRRLICTMYGLSNAALGFDLAYSRLVAVDADGQNPLALGAREKDQDWVQQSDGYVVDWRDGKTDRVLLARTYVPSRNDYGANAGGMADGLGIDLLDTRTGKVDHVESADRRAVRYLGDGRGNIRLMGLDSVRVGAQTRGVTEFVYRTEGSRDWKKFSTYNGVTNEGLYPLAVDGTNGVAYALRKDGGRDALYRVALDGSLKTELAFAHPTVDVDNVVRVGRNGRVVAARYSTDKPELHYIDPAYETLVAGLSKALKALPLIRIVDSSADETAHLIHASSDTDPGRYFLYNKAKKSLMPLAQDRPELAGVALAAVKPITYAAADGTQIPAYLTLPPGAATPKGLPAVVMPHGGPASRDEWGFDWLAQFLANRGYAVIQPNYRGSSGFGQEWFRENGFKSWKIAIGDVADAGRWLVKEGIADPARLAVLGWSYGGYAALQSQVADPDLFKAVVAIAPVTDLGMLRDEQRGFTNATVARNYIGDGPHLEEGSPARHSARFKAPVLMFHGDKDINVGVAEARAMDKRLRGAGKKSELVVYPGLDHQLATSEARTDMLARTDAFLAKALH